MMGNPHGEGSFDIGVLVGQTLKEQTIYEHLNTLSTRWNLMDGAPGANVQRTYISYVASCAGSGGLAAAAIYITDDCDPDRNALMRVTLQQPNGNPQFVASYFEE